MNLNELKVLVAENDEECQLKLLDCLSTASEITKVYNSNDGLEALRLINRHDPDVIILDTTLPSLDGIGVLEKLSKSSFRTDVVKIIISNISNDSMVENASSLGCDYYFIKPINGESFINRIKYLAKCKFYKRRGSFYTEFIKTREVEEEYLLEAQTANLIHDLGVPQHLQGFNYLKEAILIGLENEGEPQHITKDTYPVIAQKNKTSVGIVERAMRRAIEYGWNNYEIGSLKYLFDRYNSKKRPTNSEFIAVVTNKLRYEYKDKKNYYNKEANCN